MVAAVAHGGLEVHHLEAAEHAALSRFADTGVDGGDEFLGNHAADDLVLKRVAFAGLDGFDLDPAVTELAVAAGLAHIASLGLGGLADGLACRQPGACPRWPPP